MATINVSELTGAALDRAVALALFWVCERPQDGQFIDSMGWRRLVGYYGPAFHGKSTMFNPSTEWEHCGPLIDQHSAIFTLSNGQFRAEILGGAGLGENHKVAICRAIVAAKFGKTMGIPQELLYGYDN
jgi:hypothetical protein